MRDLQLITSKHPLLVMGTATRTILLVAVPARRRAASITASS